MSLTVEGEEEERGEGGWGGEENREGEWRSTRERLGGVRRGKRAGGGEVCQRVWQEGSSF